MKKNLFVLVAFCLFILAAIVPVVVSATDDGSVIMLVWPDSQAFSYGDMITFNGVNTASGTTYLFITGPNLDPDGSQIQSSHPRDSPVTDGNASTFKAVSGFGGTKWHFEWDTRNVLIDAGTYTVYAASEPRDLPHINSTHYTKISFIIRRPPVSSSSPSAGSDAPVTIARLDKLRYIIGEDTVMFSGTNTASGTTYLFITGPNLDVKGSQIQKDWPREYPVTDGDASTFQVAVVGPDNRWSYTWDTHNAHVDSGAYTVYAAGAPRDIPHINSTHSDRISFIMLPPKGAILPTDTVTSTGAGDDSAVTITQPKSGRFSIGDTLTFSGTNTGSGITYLFITGPNLATDGSQIQSTRPGDSPVIDGDASTFLAAGVGPDHQWSYTWNSQKVRIDAGLYSIYAASTPRDFSHINNTHHARTDVIMMRPANIEPANGNLTVPSVVMKGDTITISGTVKGNPVPGVAIWIIGAPGSGMAGYADQVIVQPDSTGSYSLDLNTAPARLEEGKFHVIVQQPMQNGVFDIYLGKDGWVWNRMLKENDANGTKIFRIQGPGSLQGNDAYEALVQVFIDPAVDDTIAIFPSTVGPIGSGDTGTENQLTGDQNRKIAKPVNLLDQAWGFLSGLFLGK